MNNPLLMRRLEGGSHLLRDRQRLPSRERADHREAIGQRVAVDQFHHQHRARRRFFDPVECGDMRMVQRGEDARFALEARPTVRIDRQRGWQDLNRYLASEPCIAGAIHLSHPAGPERFDDLEGSDSAAGSVDHPA